MKKKLFSYFNRQQPQRFERQVRPHLESLHRYASRLTGHVTDAEDLVQELLLSLYRKNIDLDTLDKPDTWLLKSLYHQFIDFTRRQQRNPSRPNTDDLQNLLETMPDESARAEFLAEQQALQRGLQLALASLNPEQKALVVLHDMEGFTLNELATILDTPLGTLKSRLHRARQALRTQLFVEPFSESVRVTG
ncbi:MAG: RNA polymerase sigma factor [Gammaproteobacteria bacterium]|jgi:RNA polymerase sigma factor (sigma-70 family)